MEQCEARNLSWSEACRRAGVAPNTISDIANGGRVGMRRLSSLAAFFGVTDEFIYRLAGVLQPEVFQPSGFREEREVIAMLRSLSQDMRSLAVALLRTLAQAARPRPFRVDNEAEREYTVVIPGDDDDLKLTRIAEAAQQIPPERRQQVLDYIRFLISHPEPLETGGALTHEMEAEAE